VRDLLGVYRLWGGQAGWLALGMVVSLAAVASFVVLLTQSGRTVAVALVSGLLAAPLLLRVAGGLRVMLRYLERLLTHEATFRALADLRVWFFRGLALRAAGGLGFRRSGDVLSRLVNDVEALDGLYLRITVPGAAALLLTPAVAWLIWPHGAVLAVLVTLLFAAAAIVVPLVAARIAMQGAGRLAETTAGVRVAALDLLGGLREARAFGAEDRLLARLRVADADRQSALNDLTRRGAQAQGAAALCAQLALLAVLAAVAWQGRADPVVAVGLVFLTVAVFDAVSGLPRAGALAGHAAASAQRVMQAASGPIATPPPDHPASLPSGTSLRFEQVVFAWQPDRPLVFDNFTLDIPRGARVAVLGPSGAGKSTLAALALRVVLPQSGRVLLGGADIASLAPADVRSRFAWLSQATHLFDDTIRANLLLGNPDADDAALWAALDAAQIGDVVRALPDRLDSWVGESGTRFSGGQGRRLALARALLSPAPILILDEPCAGLDAQTEQDFFTTLNEVTAGRTVLLIAHRLTGVEKLDRIYRLSAGHAVAAAG
jgi:ATP-binding cassette subfamily C protein CydC